MADIYGILNVAKGALLAQQRAINVTSHNIANVNTPGYSRQRVNMETNIPMSFTPGQIGTGVQAAGIERVYDRFLGLQINAETQNLGKWEAQKGGLEKVEILLNETSEHGLNQAMNEFWNAWNDLVNNPAGQTERMILSAKSDTLAKTFNNIYSSLKQIQTDLDTNIKGSVSEINRIADQIAALNQQIANIEISRQNANDLRDKRDLLLNELSTMIDTTTSEDSDGKVTVLVNGGRPLVQNETSWHLSTETNSSGLQNIVWLDGAGNSVNITDTISGGRMKGWLEVRDVVVPGYLNSLDDLANEIRLRVNNLHSSGFGLDGSTGNTFFIGTSASDISVNPNILAAVDLIAAAGAAAGIPGDNSIAIAIANLQNEFTMSGNTTTFSDFYNSMVSDLGNAVQEASINYDHQSEVVNHLNNYRESVSGVSIEEEMVNLIRFQHAYEAAAKLISTADELLETLISMV